MQQWHFWAQDLEMFTSEKENKLGIFLNFICYFKNAFGQIGEIQILHE